MISLDDMRLFVEVVKANGFKNASNVMNVPTSTLSRRISLLEKAIGLRLLNRTTRKIELTEAGAIYFERCKRVVIEAELAHEALDEMSYKPSGLLRVSTTQDFAKIFLLPYLAEFAECYPEINCQFHLSDEKINLVGNPVDLAIRIGRLEDSHYIARFLTQSQLRLYASPTYLARNRPIQIPENLAELNCLAFGSQQKWQLTQNDRMVEIPISGRFSANNIGFLCQLASDGLGIALLPDVVAKNAVQNGLLTEVLPDWQGGEHQIYALTETKLIPAKTQVFIDFLKEKLHSNQDAV
ncbi:putative HTH-type transcriptional regulator [Actinobacillus lignieresii]|uniref:LysR family transcriptional regulator n=1 Tax=Actinobacillus lignieresii TaxID=720 RepID=UPI000F6CFFC1|nr:LysR family transcriptional regulator [Actinobacillus lignieresii]VEB27431.1 putative HTH-type transcriptional regulator [Actinobacillus lignieresii]